MYQIIKLNAHLYFSQKIESSQVEILHETRRNSQQNLRIPFMRSNKCQNSFIFVGSKYWNELPISLKNSENAKIFKTKLKHFSTAEFWLKFGQPGSRCYKLTCYIIGKLNYSAFHSETCQIVALEEKI